jgi:hypothetical protein
MRLPAHAQGRDCAHLRKSGWSIPARAVKAVVAIPTPTARQNDTYSPFDRLNSFVSWGCPRACEDDWLSRGRLAANSHADWSGGDRLVKVGLSQSKLAEGQLEHAESVRQLATCPDVGFIRKARNLNFLSHTTASLPSDIPKISAVSNLLNRPSVQPSRAAMARFSRDKRPSRSATVSPWMTAFYICAILFAPMLFMGMIPTAAADQEPLKDTSVTGPGMHPSRWLTACDNADFPQ